MELEDFCYYFKMLFICGENPSFIDRDVDCGWKYQTYEGSWVAGKSAGGDLSDCESPPKATGAPAQSRSADVWRYSQILSTRILSIAFRWQRRTRKRREEEMCCFR